MDKWLVLQATSPRPETLARVRALAEDKNIDLVVDCNRNLPQVYQDQAKVQLLQDVDRRPREIDPRVKQVVASLAGVTRLRPA